jgi:hypothetical protein
LDFRTVENACSSWPTIAATEARQGYQRRPVGAASRQNQQSLTTVALDNQWPTPTAHDGRRPGDDALNSTQHANLKREAMQWPTPKANAFEEDPQTFHARNAELAASQSKGASGMPLAVAVQSGQWETPTAALTNGKRQARSGDRSDELLLTGQALATSELWTTPTTDFDRNGKYQQGGTPLSMQAGSLSPHQAPPTHDGAISSPARRTLNPLFVEWMHGWLIGWTDCENAATGFQAWLLRSRGALSSLCSIQSIDRSLLD